MADPFVAEIRIFPFNFAPKGWAWCDGQLLPISQNTALFSLLGHDLRRRRQVALRAARPAGRAPMHPGQGPGLTSLISVRRGERDRHPARVRDPGPQPRQLESPTAESD